ncbi:MAG: 50S ribosomal protein L7/L12 [Candidatus Wallbacteria bacterium HGW-Wallbacteria-1]|jgi:large subunit ribosomal protein L7/L12|uniref:Large ribosomal subunit protein bL12 n=1 Tax=Candidatus Wallbacteria bacterium HGW-Wallbacteria-1 TaxID=2013854 RepID=A0A2N1PSX1_9BACT|nr:MAG: 50S ribosomal protein L7/L12 [Candidatus Wallbacteria bacterium HGW-Wallbacteria-1]
MDRTSLIEALEKMTVVEINDLVKDLEERWGVSAAAPVAMAAAAAAPAAAVEEQTEFAVVMESFGDKKIQVIKVIRELLGLGLKEAKDLVEAVPAKVKEGIEKAEAESIKAKLEESGASVSIK